MKRDKYLLRTSNWFICSHFSILNLLLASSLFFSRFFVYDLNTQRIWIHAWQSFSVNFVSIYVNMCGQIKRSDNENSSFVPWMPFHTWHFVTGSGSTLRALQCRLSDLSHLWLPLESCCHLQARIFPPQLHLLREQRFFLCLICIKKRECIDHRNLENDSCTRKIWTNRLTLFPK